MRRSSKGDHLGVSRRAAARRDAAHATALARCHYENRGRWPKCRSAGERRSRSARRHSHYGHNRQTSCGRRRVAVCSVQHIKTHASVPMSSTAIVFSGYLPPSPGRCRDIPRTPARTPRVRAGQLVIDRIRIFRRPDGRDVFEYVAKIGFPFAELLWAVLRHEHELHQAAMALFREAINVNHLLPPEMPPRRDSVHVVMHHLWQRPIRKHGQMDRDTPLAARRT